MYEIYRLYWVNWSKLLYHRTLGIDILQNNIAAVTWKCIAFLKIDHRIIHKQFGVKPGTYGMGENIRNALYGVFLNTHPLCNYASQSSAAFK